MAHKFRPSQGKNQSAKFSAGDAKAEKPAQQQPPLFSLQYLAGPYCVSVCDNEHKAAFASTLHKLSKLTWAEISNAPRRGNGYEKIPQDQLMASLPSHITKDVNILAFRYHGKSPMLGYRDGRTFHVLFLDRDFTLYDHE